MAPKPKDPWTALGEALAPALAVLTEFFRLQAAIPALVKRIAEAQKAGEGLDLSADDVKTLCVTLTSLSDQKKKV